MSLAVDGLQAMLVAERALQASWSNQPESRIANIIPFDPMVREFSLGLDGERPDRDVVEMAHRLVQGAREKTNEPEISVDVDGALSFDLRLASGLLMFAELEVNGILDFTVLDDSGPEAHVITHSFPATEAKFIDQF